MALTDDLIAWYDLEESTGTRFDAANDNDLSDDTGVGVATGQVGNAALFSASNSDLLSGPNLPFRLSGDRSLALWVYPTNTNGFIIGIAGSQQQNQWALRVTSGGDLLLFYRDGTGTNSNYNTGIALTQEQWHFIVMTWDATALEFMVEVNRGTPVVIPNANGLADQGRPLALGKNPFNSQNPFSGRIDSVGWWHRVLSDAEIEELWNGGDGVSFADLAGGGGEEPVEVSAALTLGSLSITGQLGREAALSGALTLGQIAATGVLAREADVSGALTLGNLSLTGSIGQIASVSGALTLGNLSALGTLEREAAISAALTLGALSAAGEAERETAVSAALTLGALGISGALSQQSGVSGSLTLGKLSLTGALSREAALSATLTLGRLEAAGAITREAAISAALTLGQLSLSGTVGTPALSLSGALTLGRLQAAGTLTNERILSASLTLGRLAAEGQVDRETALQAALTLGALRINGLIGQQEPLAAIEVALMDALSLSPSLSDAITISPSLSDQVELGITLTD